MQLRVELPALQAWFLAHKRSASMALLVGLALVILLAPLPLFGADPAERHFKVEAGSFQFSPNSMAVNQGDRVTIDLVSTDVVHGLSIDGYDVAMSADPGQTTSVTFVASRPGAFRFRCAVPCGNLHPFMIGKFQVGPNLLLLRSGVLSILVVMAGFIGLKK